MFTVENDIEGNRWTRAKKRLQWVLSAPADFLSRLDMCELKHIVRYTISSLRVMEIYLLFRIYFLVYLFDSSVHLDVSVATIWHVSIVPCIENLCADIQNQFNYDGEIFFIRTLNNFNYCTHPPVARRLGHLAQSTICRYEGLKMIPTNYVSI